MPEVFKVCAIAGRELGFPIDCSAAGKASDCIAVRDQRFERSRFGATDRGCGCLDVDRGRALAPKGLPTSVLVARGVGGSQRIPTPIGMPYSQRYSASRRSLSSSTSSTLGSMCALTVWGR